MVATNASGARALRHGYTRDYVVGLRAVLDGGEAADVAPLPRPIGDAMPPGRWGEIVRSGNAVPREVEPPPALARLMRAFADRQPAAGPATRDPVPTTQRR